MFNTKQIKELKEDIQRLNSKVRYLEDAECKHCGKTKEIED